MDPLRVHALNPARVPIAPRSQLGGPNSCPYAQIVPTWQSRGELARIPP